ncbi:unnamed protein product [Leuciscus chuanchicus]
MEGHFVLTAYVELAPIAVGYYVSGSFALADLGMCEPPPSSSVYCSNMSLLQDRYALSAGSDADSDPEGVMTPERAVQLWSGQPLKSRRSSCLSSPDHSVLTLTDSENEHKTDEESVHSHLHCFERVQLQVVMTALDSQLFNLLPICRLVTIVYEADGSSSNFKSLTEWSLAVQSLALLLEKSSEESTHPWRAPVLIVQVLDVNFPSLTSCCLFVRKLVIH